MSTMMKNTILRRHFLQAAAAGAATMLGELSPRCTSASDQPRNGGDRLRVAVIGLGNRGRGMAEWQFPPYMDVVAIWRRSVADSGAHKTG